MSRLGVGNAGSQSIAHGKRFRIDRCGPVAILSAMKAAYQGRYGSPEVVEIRDLEVPVPTDDQVLVRVKAASVNRGDLDGLKPKPGFIRLFAGLRAPRNHSVGLDAAGSP